MHTDRSATMTRHAWQAGLLAFLMAMPLAVVQAQKPKTDPTPDWPCRVVFRDAASDVVQSDQLGAYVNGVGGVGCKIINEPGNTHHLWLFMNITGTRRTPPTRSVTFREQTFEGATYPSFQNHGTFEVKGLATLEWNAASPISRDVLPFRAYLRHPDLPFAYGLATLNGDSNFTGGAPTFGTSSVFVQPLDACS
jgi:hypothetical protein